VRDRIRDALCAECGMVRALCGVFRLRMAVACQHGFAKLAFDP
jgi:hypothetical protein